MDFSFLSQYYKFFLSGTKNTIIISIFTVFLGVIFGIFLALMKLSKNKILKFTASTYIEFVRGTPILVQLFIIYYGLPMLGIPLPKIPGMGSEASDILAGIITLSINSTAYVAEIIRSGIQSIDKGQMEAASSLGISNKIAMRYVIIPQAFKNILPALGNEFITIIKESSIVSIIGVPELMYNTDTIRGNTFKPFAPLIVAAFIYFILTFTLSKLLNLFERRMSNHD
ncbi:amino acid ABC transporter permease [Haloimpatiens sp. FM7330]|uniref:amino acid ABC transporter permease n=1 Tax=Haloimpatiens sp. FM7330 TaxID=3298610 RepID=UPI0036404612